MGIFEHFPYLNFHDINLDWLLKQTKKNAADNAEIMSIFHWFEDQGLVGTVTDITENADDTVKIDYVTLPDGTPDDFTVYNKTGADNAISGAQSAAESYAENYADNLMKGLADLTEETSILDTDLFLINRSGAAEAVNGETLGKKITTIKLDNVDLDTLYGQAYTGFYFVNENCPNSIADYTGLLVIGYGGASYQISWSRYDAFFRGRGGGSWSTWKKITINRTVETFTVDCDTAGDAGTYVGTYTITGHPNAVAIIPLYARKGGTSYIYQVAVESGTIRLQGVQSATGITVGVYIIE